MSDYIKRDDATSKPFRYLLPNGKSSLPVVFVKDIQQIPAADVVERKRGRWLIIDGCAYCSYCRNNFKKAIMSQSNYCPKCGADMRGDT